MIETAEENLIILKDSFRYSVSTYLLVGFSIITGFATRSILGPALMGTFTQLMVIFQYGKYYHCGVFNALERELPYYNGRRDHAKVAEIKEVGFSWAVLASFAVAVAMTVSSMIFRADGNLLIGVRIMAVALIIQSVVSFLTVLAKTHHKFALLSKYNVFTAVLQTILTIYLGLTLGLFGILSVSVIVGALGAIFLMKSKLSFMFTLRFSWKELARLFRIGTPLLISDIALVSLMNMDKFSIIKYFGKTELGYYSIAIMLSNYIYMLPSLIYSVLFPRFYESFGRVGDIKKLRHYLETPTVIIAFFIAGITGYMMLALPFLIRYILPGYVAGVAAAQILLLGMFFMSLQGMSTYLLIVMNKQKQMIALSGFGMLLAVFFNYIFVGVFHWNIEGVAAAMLATYFLYNVIFTGYAFRHHSKKPAHLIEYLVKVYMPFLWLVSVVFLLNLVLPYKGHGLAPDFVNITAKLLIFTVAYIPALYYLNTKTHIMDKVFKLIKASFWAKR